MNRLTVFLVSLLFIPFSLLAQQQVPIVSGSVTLPGASGYYRVLLNQNVTSLSIQGPPTSPAGPISVIFVQDATGGRTVSGYASNILNTSNITVASAANAYTTVQLNYDASGNNWIVAGGGGGGGSVTSFSAGNLSPLFTSSVATPTNTPALSFSLSTAGAHNFLGNNTGSTGAPGYVQPAFTDLSGVATASQMPPQVAPNQNVIYVSKNCGNQANCYQTTWDGIQLNDGVVSSGSPNVSSAGQATWASTDVGKEFAAYSTCTTDPSPIAVDVFPAGATILSVTDATHIVISGNASANIASAACMVYGHPDDTALAAVNTALTTMQFCPVVVLPAGIGLLDNPVDFLSANPPGCTRTPQNLGKSAFGTGLEVRGQGIGGTVIGFTSNFKANIATGCNNDCFFMPLQSKWDNFSFSGFGESLSGIAETPHQLLGVAGYNVLDNIGMYNYGQRASSGMEVIFNGTVEYAKNFELDGFGTLVLNSAGALILGPNAVIQDLCGKSQVQVSGGGINIQNNVTIMPGDCTVSDSGGGGGLIFVTSGSVLAYGPLALGPVNGDTSNVITGVLAQGSGASFTSYGGSIDLRSGNTGNLGILCQTSAACSVQNERIYAGSAGDAIATNSPSTFSDLGGNQILQGVVSIAGTLFGSASVTGAAQTAANITPSTGWGTTGAAGNGVSAVSGTSKTEQFTITAAGTPSANPTAAIVFPTSFWAAPICTAQQVGGTGAINTISVATPTTTGVTLTWNGTPVAASTYSLTVSCGNP